MAAVAPVLLPVVPVPHEGELTTAAAVAGKLHGILREVIEIRWFTNFSKNDGWKPAREKRSNGVRTCALNNGLIALRVNELMSILQLNLALELEGVKRCSARLDWSTLYSSSVSIYLNPNGRQKDDIYLLSSVAW